MSLHEGSCVKPKRKFTVLIEQDEEGYYVLLFPPFAVVTPRLRHSTP